ncbi:immunity 22 family protein [Pedobacter sp. MC2016-24]|uniref:immunity 22 family protein n=1 Tax=Pedobacter sp. MC2016-24 TaxID=2780090 RepID=UPI00187FEC67|nr:immunity 22 family protein [Pedobacter sp. MC2016-24]MBE9601360.1 immunity 22 family protein [Pedobacter sp. MC2016-24]
MNKIHIWTGKFASQQALNNYLDQQPYLKAWEKYDHEPPTGNQEQDAEPDPSLRCEFCKEISLDIYNEDTIIIKYYPENVAIGKIAKDILVSSSELKDSWSKTSNEEFNTVVAYQDKDLSPANATKTRLLQYLGQLNQTTVKTKKRKAKIHHLWIGEKNLNTKAILKTTGLTPDQMININFYYSKVAGKLDEIIILQVEDFEIAESMILAAAEMAIPDTVHAMLELILSEDAEISVPQVSATLEMHYVGKFIAE